MMIEKIFEKLLDTSVKFSEHKKTFIELFVAVKQLTNTVLNLSITVHSHQQSLNDLYEVQSQIIKQISNSTYEYELPFKTKKEIEKPN